MVGTSAKPTPTKKSAKKKRDAKERIIHSVIRYRNERGELVLLRRTKIEKRADGGLKAVFEPYHVKLDLKDHHDSRHQASVAAFAKLSGEDDLAAAFPDFSVSVVGHSTKEVQCVVDLGDLSDDQVEKLSQNLAKDEAGAASYEIVQQESATGDVQLPKTVVADCEARETAFSTRTRDSGKKQDEARKKFNQAAVAAAVVAYDGTTPGDAKFPLLAGAKLDPKTFATPMPNAELFAWHQMWRARQTDREAKLANEGHPLNRDKQRLKDELDFMDHYLTLLDGAPPLPTLNNDSFTEAQVQILLDMCQALEKLNADKTAIDTDYADVDRQRGESEKGLQQDFLFIGFAQNVVRDYPGGPFNGAILPASAADFVRDRATYTDLQNWLQDLYNNDFIPLNASADRNATQQAEFEILEKCFRVVGDPAAMARPLNLAEAAAIMGLNDKISSCCANAADIQKAYAECPPSMHHCYEETREFQRVEQEIKELEAKPAPVSQADTKKLARHKAFVQKFTRQYAVDMGHVAALQPLHTRAEAVKTAVLGGAAPAALSAKDAARLAQLSTQVPRTLAEEFECALLKVCETGLDPHDVLNHAYLRQIFNEAQSPSSSPFMREQARRCFNPRLEASDTDKAQVNVTGGDADMHLHRRGLDLVSDQGFSKNIGLDEAGMPAASGHSQSSWQASSLSYHEQLHAMIAELEGVIRQEEARSGRLGIVKQSSAVQHLHEVLSELRNLKLFDASDEALGSLAELKAKARSAWVKMADSLDRYHGERGREVSEKGLLTPHMVRFKLAQAGLLDAAKWPPANAHDWPRNTIGQVLTFRDILSNPPAVHDADYVHKLVEAIAGEKKVKWEQDTDTVRGFLDSRVDTTVRLRMLPTYQQTLATAERRSQAYFVGEDARSGYNWPAVIKILGWDLSKSEVCAKEIAAYDEKYCRKKLGDAGYERFERELMRLHLNNADPRKNIGNARKLVTRIRTKKVMAAIEKAQASDSKAFGDLSTLAGISGLHNNTNAIKRVPDLKDPVVCREVKRHFLVKLVNKRVLEHVKPLQEQLKALHKIMHNMPNEVFEGFVERWRIAFSRYFIK